LSRVALTYQSVGLTSPVVTTPKLY